jgi:hypothetical protein
VGEFAFAMMIELHEASFQAEVIDSSVPNLLFFNNGEVNEQSLAKLEALR